MRYLSIPKESLQAFCSLLLGLLESDLSRLVHLLAFLYGVLYEFAFYIVELKEERLYIILLSLR